MTYTELGFIGIDQNSDIIEVKWLNRNGNIGKGYDFVILKNEKEIEYIEVKTTVKMGETYHDITGTQWNWAWKLFKQGDGDKYLIYAVKGAASDNAEIKSLKNPIKEWNEGRLFLHPLMIKV